MRTILLQALILPDHHKSSFSSVCHVVLLLLMLTTSPLNSQQISFDKLTQAQGLSHDNITCIMQDSRGFMWFGTLDGLNRFDGYEVKVFEPSNDGNGFKSPMVRSMVEDEYGNIWFTSNELIRYDPKSQVFQTFEFLEPKSKTKPDLYSIRQDDSGRLWMASYSGLILFDPRTETFELFSINDSNDLVSDIIIDNSVIWLATRDGIYSFEIENRQFSKLISDEFAVGFNPIELFLDFKKRLWIGTEGQGLFCLNAKTKKVTHINSSADHYGFDSKVIRSLHSNGENGLWVGTGKNGLFYLDFLNNQFTNFDYDPFRSGALSSRSIYSLLEDKQGILWVGTYDQGINIYNPNTQYFSYFSQEPENNQSLSNSSVLALEPDEKGIWIGTDGGGLNYFDSQSKEFTRYSQIKGLTAEVYKSLFITDDNHLWAGTYLEGLERINLDTWQVEHFTTESTNGRLQDNSIWSIYQDRKGQLWIGTLFEGLAKVDVLKTGQVSFTHYNTFKGYPENLPNVTVIFEDSEGCFWLGSEGGGLSLFNRETKQIDQSFWPEKGIDGVIADNFITAINEDPYGYLWVGTLQGVSILDKKKGTFFSIDQNDGLESDAIAAIYPRNEKEMWVTTDVGISLIDIESKKVINYNDGHGVKADPLNFQALIRNGDQFYFGGKKGLNTINADKDIGNNTLIPKVILTDFFVNNKPVNPGEAGLLEEGIGYTSKVTLSPDQRDFGVGFVALNYTFSSKNQYQYMLEGYDTDWITVSKQRKAYYTNVPRGKTYTFKVIASNNDGVWNKDGVSLEIYVKPYWWDTWLFQLFAVMVISFLVYAIYYWRIQTIKKLNLQLEYKINESTKELKTANAVITERNNFLNEQTLRLSETKAVLEKTNKDLKTVIDEREVLFREVHHRVKNNLSLVLSILRIASRKASEGPTTNILLETQDRIRAMSMIHQTLYGGDEKGVLSMDKYLPDLVMQIVESYKSNHQKVDVNMDIIPVKFDLKVTNPLALIINELISNCLKHAFSDTAKPAIRVSLKKNKTGAKKYKLTVLDNGKGMNLNFKNMKDESHYGLKLVLGLIEQIEAEMKVSNLDPGLRIDINF